MQMTTRRVSNPRLSPSGGLIAFEVADADLEHDRWVRTTVVTPADPTDGASTERVYAGWDARWGPSDQRLFIRANDSDGAERVCELDIQTGAITPVTTKDVSVGWYQPSEDGRSIAYTSFEPAADGTSARWALFVIDIASRETTRLDIPGSAAEFAWSPDGARLAVAYQPELSGDWRSKSIAIVNRRTGDVRHIPRGSGAAWMPAFSPAGDRVAFVTSAGPATWMRDARIGVYDLASGSVTTLHATPDQNADLLAWRADGRALLALEYQGSTRRLLSLPTDGARPEYLGEANRSIRNPHVRGSRVTYVFESWNQPPEVFVADAALENARRVTDVQPSFVTELGQTETIRWISDDGVEIEGILTYPVGYRDDERVPLLVRLHGGPPFPASDGFLGGTYLTAYPLASFASEGFAILQPNFRGSTGYGKGFRHALRGDWGGQDFRDVMSGIDALVSRGVVDPKRVGIMGWSYGGYLTAWAVTQSDRFDAASIGAAMVDLTSFEQTTSLGGMLRDWFPGSEEARDRLLRQRSPLTHASRTGCPVLLQHGDKDPRVPIQQVHRFFEELERVGVNAELSVYGGGHGARSPRAVLSVLERNLEWFVTHIPSVQADGD